MDFSMVEKVTLDNGFRVLFLNNEFNKSAAAYLWIGSGSRLEASENAGVSHFVEHMLFKGTETRTARDLAEQTDYIGGLFNAFTTKQNTCVYARTLTSHLAEAIDIIGDMVCHTKLAPEDIDVERGVILEEIGMYEDSPEDLMVDTLYAKVWSDSMLGANILGTRETVGGMTAAQMREHMRVQYSPHRMVLAVCGSFDREAVLAQVKEIFGGLANSGVPYIITPAEYHRSVALVEKDFEQTQLCLAFPTFGSEDDDRFALTIFNSICGGASSSRLYQRIREQMGLAYSVDSAVTSYKCEGMMTVAGGVSPKKDLDALAEMVKVLCELRRDGVTEREFDRTREHIKTSLVMGIEGNGAAASHMGRGELMRGSIMTEDELLARYEAVTLEDVNRMARRFIDFDNFSLCAVGKVRPEEDYIRVVQDNSF